MRTLTADEWREEQEITTRNRFGCTAVEFVHRFKSGAYDHQEDPELDPNADLHCDLMWVLGMFPGLDDIECNFKWSNEADLAATALLEDETETE